MSKLQLAFATWGALFALLGLVMALARTPPNDAVSNLSKWAEWAGFHHIPKWLRDRRADNVAYRWAARSLAVLIVFGILGLTTFLFMPTAPFNTVTSHQVAPTPKIPDLPSIPRTDSPVHGWLKPANYPIPPNGCTGKVPDSSTKVLIGNNAAAILGYGGLVVLEIRGCPALSIERSQEGALLDALINDGSGVSPVRVTHNEIVAQNGETYSARQSADESKLTVKNYNGRVLLEAEFLNQSTIRVKGSFGCLGGPIVPVTEDHPIPGVFMNNFCAAGGRAAFSVN